MSLKITPVILCGGSGTRLWPLSRTGFPKQFLCLTGQESLFQQAALRLSKLGNSELEVSKPLIVTGEDHRFLAAEQLREIGIALGAALLEPAGRNTAPALTLAALSACEGGEDPILVVTPADQTVRDTEHLTHGLLLQQEQAEDFVSATGVQNSVYDFVEAASKELSMPIRCEGSGIEEKGFMSGPDGDKLKVAVDPRHFRPTEVETLLGDANKAKTKLGWTQQTSFSELVSEMVQADLNSAQRDVLIRQHGLKAMQYHE